MFSENDIIKGHWWINITDFIKTFYETSSILFLRITRYSTGKKKKEDRKITTAVKSERPKHSKTTVWASFILINGHIGRFPRSLSHTRLAINKENIIFYSHSGVYRWIGRRRRSLITIIIIIIQRRLQWVILNRRTTVFYKNTNCETLRGPTTDTIRITNAVTKTIRRRLYVIINIVIRWKKNIPSPIVRPSVRRDRW